MLHRPSLYPNKEVAIALPQKPNRIRVNRAIRAVEVRVINQEGEQLGVLSIGDALKAAEAAGLDLVEVSPTAVPPACRIMDYGRMKYEQSKKAHAQHLHRKGSQLKEVKLRLGTGEHDIAVKVRHARELLQLGNKVKITLTFRGREMAYQEQGRTNMSHVQEQMQDVGQPESPLHMEGRFMTVVMLPKARKGQSPKTARP